MTHIIFKKNLPTIRQLTKLLAAEAMKRASNDQGMASKMLGVSQKELKEILTKQGAFK